MNKGMLVNALIRFEGFTPVEALKEASRRNEMREAKEAGIESNWQQPKRESQIDKFNRKYGL